MGPLHIPSDFLKSRHVPPSLLLYSSSFSSLSLPNQFQTNLRIEFFLKFKLSTIENILSRTKQEYIYTRLGYRVEDE